MRGLNPITKFGLVLAGAGWAVCAPGLVAKAALVALAVVGAGKKIFSRRFFRLAILFSLFIFAVQALLGPGEPAWEWGPFSVSREALRLGGNMALRFLGILGVSLWFVVTTPPDDFARALSSTRVPYRYTYLLVLALRFLPLLRQEYYQVRAAQRVRGLELRPWRLGSHIRWTFLPVLGGALGRAEGIALAMEGRGFGLYPSRVPMQPWPWTWRDLGGGVVLAGVVAACCWFAAGGGAGWP